MSSMDDLITLVNPPAYWPKIRYSNGITLAGSCFAEHISAKMVRYKYNVLSNPFGILFNPVSMARSFDRIADKEFYHEDELIFHEGLYHSMDHHGSFSGKSKEAVVESINSGIEKANNHISKSQFVFVSLGSAKVYRYRETGQIVGNCHKIPQDQFDHFRLTLAECELTLGKMAESIKQLSPEVHIIWTVSPVRHLKDGFEENQRSKATLLLAIDRLLIGQHGGYFPAYEIMMDQLRDYRYYARDLTHPSALAIDIIWDIFTGTFLEHHEKEAHHHIEKVCRAMEHRLIHEDNNAIKAFAEKQLKNIEHLAGIYPNMDWKEERQYFFHLIEPD